MSLIGKVRQDPKVKTSHIFNFNFSVLLWIIGGGIALLCPYALFFSEEARSQQPVGPILWRDPNINWTPGAQQQTYEQRCPGNPNRVTISFFQDYDRENSDFTPPTLVPVDASTEIGTGGGPAREILFTSMGATPITGSNPGRFRRDRQTRIEIIFDSPVSLGNFFMADIDRAVFGNQNTRWIDQVIVTANGGTLIPGSDPGTSFMGIMSGSVVEINGNTATGTGDSPNFNTQGNTAAGNVNIDFGSNIINSIEII